ncbi:Dol-P-Glc:Glc(2)Man(9)GlcNAc(2)-PP-Dol alpha-1,2-glucosyltransferase [Fulvia fulva]|nr:Dol-P-Glc:Glc(2)Man(9)GlcNAc(2)-PP-Dol alpha-1,2-glucosyltransferase [Fulvia fulva]KAK4611165.1 Dol-P-Glc:Glc(2)Man(9)GlcNAc(2)-PP-Dol alpha-1,2-glucosyltransferase [Fulvia fulva]WPV21767.1 Dol-P-Glc:Glc(2)Man(9)GlcNAc(2)-PP-Dol alpha-1,2-glucosyltransferase [Fulvia fulva]WPV36919.1 Dol-P-Glc:Glc(2)Man(9)GlcNAc(2)-PP-Dol alpha-1,2-glucosyltransferase [Fulvia fulva]
MASVWEVALAAPLNTWFAAVNKHVTEPYLDEVFHVRQAQHYCQGHWDVWDPKITTPPGLYFISYLLSPIMGCSITALRAANVICLVALCIIIRATYDARRKTNNESGPMSQILTYHSSLNIVLFPPIFFFSALYYTDIASTLSVMASYWYFLIQLSNKETTFTGTMIQVVLGIISLTFRQTNIFWVAVGPAALTAIVELDRGHRVVKDSMYRRTQGFGDTTYSVAKTSWKMDVIYDPPAKDACIEDYLRTTVSIVVCAAKAMTQPKRVARLATALAPYITLMVLFASFILWNGSVVLGDKSNHNATIHIAQMLYLWPFIAFFAWPLLLPHFILLPLIFISRLGQLAHVEPLQVFRRRDFLPRMLISFGFLILALVIVRFNTIVHPFTLADNRHYNFYILKLLLRPWWVRYMVTPVYVVTAWACLEQRGEAPIADPSKSGETSPASGRMAAAYEQGTEKRNTESSQRILRLADGKSSAMVSFQLVCVLTAALSLCSAPLVEPRYCIIPFVIWRIHLPLYAVDVTRDMGKKGKPSWSAVLADYDFRVVIETIWFLIINAVTGYIFLYKTFEWKSEPGGLQRFMW